MLSIALVWAIIWHSGAVDRVEAEEIRMTQKNDFLVVEFLDERGEVSAVVLNPRIVKRVD